MTNGEMIIIGAVAVLVFLAFVIPPGYDESCAPYSYGGSALDWGGIPCKRGIANQCSDLFGQSPINLLTRDESREATENDLVVISEDITCQDELTVVHNKIFFPKSCSPTISLANLEYRLRQLHFHVGGSEHTVDGFRFDGEIHLVHEGLSGFVVIGVFLDTSQDEANEDLEFILEIYEGGAHRRLLNEAWNPYNLVQSLSTYFAYQGSLTTPPCSSGIKWIVTQEPLATSQDQLGRLADLYPYVPNYRPLQARGSRQVIQYASDSSSE
jgi:carbonic anhydrase